MSASPGRCASIPRLAEEMGAGRLSFSQVRVISRIAGPGEEQLVDDLIHAARHANVAQLEVLVRGLRTVDHNEQASDPGEYLKQSWTADSRWQLSARVDPERGALVGAAIDAIAQRDGCNAADALVTLAEIGLASLADERRTRPASYAATNAPQSSSTSTPRASRHVQLNATPPATRVQPNATQSERRLSRVQLNATPARLAVPRSAERDPERMSRVVARPYARIAGGPGLPDAVVLRLLCEGRIRTVITTLRPTCSTSADPTAWSLTANTAPYWRVNTVTAPTPAARTPKTCTRTTASTGSTAAAPTWATCSLLCERHHVAHHAGEFEIFPDGAGGFRFVSSDGRNLSAPHRPRADARHPAT